MTANGLPEEGGDPTQFNDDLAPIDKRNRPWGWFEIFNVWTNCTQSLFGYTLAASLFISYGLNGWAVFAGIILAGFLIMIFVNLAGRPSVKYGVPFPVIVRASMGVRGANLPAMIRGVVAIFWYGAQTYIASTAISLLIHSLIEVDSTGTFLSLTAVDWISFGIVWSFQLFLFWKGMEWIRNYLNWAGPAVYVVMIALMVVLWVEAGNSLLSELGIIFHGTGSYSGGPFAAFMAVVGTMVSYYAAVILNFGDLSRFVRGERAMRLGNFIGLPFNIAFFSFIALFVTAGTVVVFGQQLTNPTEIVGRVGSLPLTIISALTFFGATVGINLIANFVPPAYDLSNLMPSRISFRRGGLIAAGISFFVGALWVSIVSTLGIFGFVNTLGALLAPAYGILVADYYVVRRRQLDIAMLFSTDPKGPCYYWRGWNVRALATFSLVAIFSVLAVWWPPLSPLSGLDWIIGAALAALIYVALMKGRRMRL
ncbi:MAG: NCS1 family nucleobase:cation symporter-1 [Pseudomonadota bacterium]